MYFLIFVGLDFLIFQFGSWILELWVWILFFGRFGFLIFEFGSWILDLGFLSLDLGFWVS